MKQKLFALFLALAMLLSLAACGGKNNTSDSSGSDGSNQQHSDDSQDRDHSQNNQDQTPSGDEAPGEPEGGEDRTPPDSGENETPEDGASNPDTDGGETAGEGDSEEADTPETPAVGLSHEDVTLFKEGESFRLETKNVPGIYAAVYAVEDEAVASVSEDGTVTAVAPGTTRVTVHIECESGIYDLACWVRCRWEAPAAEENTPSEEDKPVSAPVKPTISEFYATLTENYEALGSLGAVEGEVLEAEYPGLASAAGVEEVMVMEPIISFSTVAVALVKMADGASADQIQAVKDILQARLDSQASGGAYYLGASDAWGEGVVTAAGGYVGMFVYSGEADNMADMFSSTYGG